MMGATNYSSLEFSEVSSHFESSVEEDEEEDKNDDDNKSGEQYASNNSKTPFDEFNTPE